MSDGRDGLSTPGGEDNGEAASVPPRRRIYVTSAQEGSQAVIGKVLSGPLLPPGERIEFVVGGGGDAEIRQRERIGLDLLRGVVAEMESRLTGVEPSRDTVRSFIERLSGAEVEWAKALAWRTGMANVAGTGLELATTISQPQSGEAATDPRGALAALRGSIEREANRYLKASSQREYMAEWIGQIDDAMAALEAREEAMFGRLITEKAAAVNGLQDLLDLINGSTLSRGSAVDTEFVRKGIGAPIAAILDVLTGMKDGPDGAVPVERAAAEPGFDSQVGSGAPVPPPPAEAEDLDQTDFDRFLVRAAAQDIGLEIIRRPSAAHHQRWRIETDEGSGRWALGQTLGAALDAYIETTPVDDAPLRIHRETDNSIENLDRALARQRAERGIAPRWEDLTDEQRETFERAGDAAEPILTLRRLIAEPQSMMRVHPATDVGSHRAAFPRTVEDWRNEIGAAVDRAERIIVEVASKPTYDSYLPFIEGAEATVAELRQAIHTGTMTSRCSIELKELVEHLSEQLGAIRSVYSPPLAALEKLGQEIAKAAEKAEAETHNSSSENAGDWQEAPPEERREVMEGLVETADPIRGVNFDHDAEPPKEWVIEFKDPLSEGTRIVRYPRGKEAMVACIEKARTLHGIPGEWTIKDINPSPMSDAVTEANGYEPVYSYGKELLAKSLDWLRHRIANWNDEGK